MKKHRGFVKLSGCDTGQVNKQNARAGCSVLTFWRCSGCTVWRMPVKR